MSQIYQIADISRQGFLKHYNRLLAKEELIAQLLPLMKDIRDLHPRMSARSIYYKIQPQGIGRDAFEAIAFANGYKLFEVKRFITTTDPTGVKRFPNHLAGLKINKVNQVWVSDITFYWLNDHFYYITVIMDLYSRFIVGCHVSDDLMTINTTIPALKMALRTRCNTFSLDRLILHSDGGGQYYCKDFLKLTKTLGIKNSMGQIVFDNTHAERVIKTLKNDYIKPYNPNNYKQLQKHTLLTVKRYNFDRSHSSLKRLTPHEFEQQINSIVVDKRPCLKVFASILTKSYRCQQKEKRSKKERVYTSYKSVNLI